MIEFLLKGNDDMAKTFHEFFDKQIEGSSMNKSLAMLLTGVWCREADIF